MWQIPMNWKNTKNVMVFSTNLAQYILNVNALMVFTNKINITLGLTYIFYIASLNMYCMYIFRYYSIYER